MSEENPEKGPGYVGPNKGPEERQEKDSKKDQLVATAAALCGVISLTVVLHGLDETLVLTGFIVVPLSSMVFVVSGMHVWRHRGESENSEPGPRSGILGVKALIISGAVVIAAITGLTMHLGGGEVFGILAGAAVVVGLYFLGRKAYRALRRAMGAPS